jgi:hypothetical protein
MRYVANRWRSSIWSIAISCFKRRAYARAFAALIAEQSEKQACRTMVGLLALAHDRACEAELADAIDAVLDAGGLPDLDALSARFTADGVVIPQVAVALVPLTTYDELAVIRTPGTTLDLTFDATLEATLEAKFDMHEMAADAITADETAAATATTADVTIADTILELTREPTSTLVHDGGVA